MKRKATLTDVDLELSKIEVRLRKVYRNYLRVTPRIPETRHRWVFQQFMDDALACVVKARASVIKAGKWIDGIPTEYQN